MRLIFGVMALLIVLAAVGTLGKKQFEAVGASGQSAARAAAQAAPGAAPAPQPAGTVVGQSQALQQHVRDAAAAAALQGAQRTEEATK